MAAGRPEHPRDQQYAAAELRRAVHQGAGRWRQPAEHCGQIPHEEPFPDGDSAGKYLAGLDRVESRCRLCRHLVSFGMPIHSADWAALPPATGVCEAGPPDDAEWPKATPLAQAPMTVKALAAVMASAARRAWPSDCLSPTITASHLLSVTSARSRACSGLDARRTRPVPLAVPVARIASGWLPESGHAAGI